MRRWKCLIFAFAVSGLLSAYAQQSPKLTLGILGAVGAEGGAAPALIEELDKLGYQRGRNLTVIFRAARDSNADLPQLAAELINGKPDVLTALSTPPVLALKKTTATIPIVMVGIGDPISTGLVQSLAHPGGNITGTANAVELWSAKRLQMITEVLPNERCVVYLRNPGNQAAIALQPLFEATMEKLGLEFKIVDTTTPEQLDAALSHPPEHGCNRAIFIQPDTMFLSKRTQLAEYALHHQMALFAPFRADAEAGALVAFGFNLDEQWRLAARYINEIARGAKPSDLPVQQPVSFEMAINLKTAKAIGVTIPAALMLSADEVIE